MNSANIPAYTNVAPVILYCVTHVYDAANKCMQCGPQIGTQ